MVAPPCIATSLAIAPVSFTETGAKTQQRDGVEPVRVGVVALAGAEVNMESRRCRMCTCEANHEEKEQRLTAGGASLASVDFGVCELVTYDNLSFLLTEQL